MQQVVVSPSAELRRRGELDGDTLARLDALRLRAKRLRAAERGLAQLLHSTRDDCDRARRACNTAERVAPTTAVRVVEREEGGRVMARYAKPAVSPDLLAAVQRTATEVARVTTEHEQAARKANDALAVYRACAAHVGLSAEFIP